MYTLVQCEKRKAHHVYIGTVLKKGKHIMYTLIQCEKKGTTSGLSFLLLKN